MKHKLSFRLILVLIGVLTLAACTSRPISVPATTTPASTAVTILQNPTVPPATLTPAAPGPTPPPATTAPLPLPLPTLAPQSSPVASGQTVKIFLVAIGDNGQSGKLIGCGDSVLAVTVPIARTQGVLKAALENLLSIKQQYYGQSGLYNALYQSNLKLDKVTIENKRAIINLSGTMTLGGVCDSPRVEAQFRETALQFSTVNDVAVFVNGKPLADVLSGR